MAGKIKAMWTNKDIRNRILFTLFAFLVYRLGSAITVPDVNTADLVNGLGENSLFAMLNLLGGGGLEQFSVFALGVTPYITASIIIQLLSMDVIPHLTELSKAGANGRKTLDKYTRYLAVVFAFVQSFSLVYGFSKTYTSLIVGGVTISKILYIATIFAAGSMFLVWIGDQISMKGIGNGISMIIFVGIISGLPSAVTMIWDLIFGTGAFSTVGLLTALAIIVGAVLLIAGVVFVQQAERRVPVQYSKKVVGRKMVGAQNTYIPLKLAMAGVMPVIFASSFMTFPAMLIQIFSPSSIGKSGFLGGLYQFSIATSTSQGVGIGYVIANAIIYLLLIIGFTYFYTYATFNPAEVANTIKKNGGFVPGIRAGKPTSDYIGAVLNKLTLFGGFFLSIIAVIPMFMRFTSLNLAFGGTAILIVVGVALETVQQLESQLMIRHYKGFLE